MITVTNPIIEFDPEKDKKNPNHAIVGVAVNGPAEIRVVIKPGQTANIDGHKTLPGIIPTWIFNQLRDGRMINGKQVEGMFAKHIREGRITVENDPVSDKMVADHKEAIGNAEKAEKSAQRNAAKQARDAAKLKAENNDDAQ